MKDSEEFDDDGEDYGEGYNSDPERNEFMQIEGKENRGARPRTATRGRSEFSGKDMKNMALKARDYVSNERSKS